VRLTHLSPREQPFVTTSRGVTPFPSTPDAGTTTAIESHRSLQTTIAGLTESAFHSAAGARLLLLGGPPFEEQVLMWWNFVARSRDEISKARAEWQEHRRFGTIPGFKGERVAAPEVLRLADPRLSSAKLENP